MTLDEAIEYQKRIANRYMEDYQRCDEKSDCSHCGNDCRNEAMEHEQFAEWLKELQAYKDKEEQGLLIELPDGYDEALAVNAIGYLDEPNRRVPNLANASFDLGKGTYISFEEGKGWKQDK